MRVLVTGAAGFVGSTLVPLLLKRGHQLTVLLRSEEQNKIIGGDADIRCLIGDLSDDKVCSHAVKEVDAIIHLAGLAHVGASKDAHRIQNYENTKRLAQAAKASEVKRFVYISSCKARYPDHSDYAFYKRASEEFLLNLNGNMKSTCLRPGIVYKDSPTAVARALVSNGPHTEATLAKGNLSALLHWLQKPTLPLFLSSNTTLAMIGVSDCCRSIIAAVEQDQLSGQVWELNDGFEYRLQDMNRIVRRARKLSATRFWVRVWWLWPVFALLGLLPPFRQRGLGLNTWRALAQEQIPVDSTFAKASGVWPSATLYQIIQNHQS